MLFIYSASKSHQRSQAFIIALLMMISLLATAEILFDMSKLQYYSDKYGSSAAERLQDWNEMLGSAELKGLPELEKLKRVNDFFNQMEFVSDLDHWGEMDYWATPVEFLATNGGDCEDFSIAKYLTLRHLGVSAEKLRITYVKALTINQAHMVLTYFTTPDAEPIVLDNLVADILPASQRDDLIPVYSFNGDNLWLSKSLRGRGQLVGGSDRIKRWKELRERMTTQ
ncbi:MAG: transglutaminase-like cysteine peptidase [Gammaproteobacteria bacterium]|nr:MAG: transglutaminase-like cysteine peptidase [Gammaproteobacteria bacterium]